MDFRFSEESMYKQSNNVTLLLEPGTKSQLQAAAALETLRSGKRVTASDVMRAAIQQYLAQTKGVKR
jgi:hypothetical protein